MAILVPPTVLLNSHSGGRVARGYPVLTGRGPGLSAIVDLLRETIASEAALITAECKSLRPRTSPSF
jgi:hypothetical protein